MDNSVPFTDGCGTISPDLADDIWSALLAQRAVHLGDSAPPLQPKAFQIRFGPAKGMVSVDYTLKGRRVSHCLV